MPHVLITCQIRLRIVYWWDQEFEDIVKFLVGTAGSTSKDMTGPTWVGDENSDLNLMEQLGAKLVQRMGDDFSRYVCDDAPRIVLNKLERLGYSVVSSTGIGQTCLWTLHKPEQIEA